MTLSQLIGSWETGELSEAITRYAQFHIKYEQLELLHEPGFKSFPHELVEVLFLKRDGFDWRVYLPELSSRRFFESGAYQIIFGEGEALIPERRLFDSGV